jgi:hypothetical protein
VVQGAAIGVGAVLGLGLLGLGLRAPFIGAAGINTRTHARHPIHAPPPRALHAGVVYRAFVLTGSLVVAASGATGERRAAPAGCAAGSAAAAGVAPTCASRGRPGSRVVTISVPDRLRLHLLRFRDPLISTRLAQLLSVVLLFAYVSVVGCRAVATHDVRRRHARCSGLELAAGHAQGPPMGGCLHVVAALRPPGGAPGEPNTVGLPE